MFDAGLPPKLIQLERPAIIRPWSHDPWAVEVNRKLIAASVPLDKRQDVIRELHRIAGVRRNILKASVDDLTGWCAAPQLAMFMVNHLIGFGSGGAVAAVFPLVTAAAADNDSGAPATSHTIYFGSSPNADDLIIVFVATQPNATAAFTGISGFTELFNTPNGLTQGYQACYYKVASGSEGSSVTVTIAASWRVIGISYFIQAGTYVGVPEGTAVADSGSSTAPDGPNLAPSWGTKKTLWITTCSMGPSNAATGWPYGDKVDAVLTGTNHPSMSSARQSSAVSSDNPGAFILGTTSRWVASTIAVQGTG